MNWAAIDERELKNRSEQKALKDFLRSQNEETKRRKQQEKTREIEEYRKITQNIKPFTQVYLTLFLINRLINLNWQKKEDSRK